MFQPGAADVIDGGLERRTRQPQRHRRVTQAEPWQHHLHHQPEAARLVAQPVAVGEFHIQAHRGGVVAPQPDAVECPLNHHAGRGALHRIQVGLGRPFALGRHGAGDVHVGVVGRGHPALVRTQRHRAGPGALGFGHRSPEVAA